MIPPSIKTILFAATPKFIEREIGADTPEYDCLRLSTTGCRIARRAGKIPANKDIKSPMIPAVKRIDGLVAIVVLRKTSALIGL